MPTQEDIVQAVRAGCTTTSQIADRLDTEPSNIRKQLRRLVENERLVQGDGKNDRGRPIPIYSIPKSDAVTVARHRDDMVECHRDGSSSAIEETMNSNWQFHSNERPSIGHYGVLPECHRDDTVTESRDNVTVTKTTVSMLPEDFDSLEPLLHLATDSADPLGLRLTDYQKTQINRLIRWCWKTKNYRAPLSVLYAVLRKLENKAEIT